MAAAVAEMFQALSRSFWTRKARSAPSLKSRSEPAPPAAGRLLGGAAQHVGEVLGLHLVVLDHDEQPLDRVLQLADVAAPGVAAEGLDRRRGEASRPHVVLGAELPREVLDEGRQVLRALAQGRHADRDHGEPEEEVLAEAALLDLLLEVLVGGGDDAHVHLDRLLRADALDLALLQHPQHLGLGAQAHVADLVEEDRALVGQLELADLLLGRPGERALLVAEQLALDQLLGDRGAVHLDERLVPAGSSCGGWPGPRAPCRPRSRR